MNILEFDVNGSGVRVTARAGDTLLHVLREHLDLRGTRFGCGLEQCGSCMVQVDGQPTFACTFDATLAHGCSVLTVEGLAGNAGPHPLQQAFEDEQAGQCGYCLSGILMSASALLARNPHPDRAEIIAALEPHLCRCGAHGRIVRAIERAACIAAEART